MSARAGAGAEAPRHISLATGDVRIPVYEGGAGGGFLPEDQEYPSPAGAAGLRAAVATACGGGSIGPDNVLVTPGARLAILAVLGTVLGPRPSVLVPTPYWPSYPELIRAAGGAPVPVPGAVGDGTVDLDELERCRTAATGAVVVNSPRNPDGAVTGRDSLRDLLAWAAGRGIFVLFDQVYRGVPGAAPAPSVLDLGGVPAPQVAVVDGLTKSHALAGLRVGWAIGERALIGRVAATAHHLTGGTCTVAQRMAVAALASTPGRQRLAGELDANRRQAHARLTALPGVSCTLPAGGIFLFPDLRDWLAGPAPEAARRDLAGWLRDRHGVVVGDGTAYGAPGHVRISFALPSRQVAAGIDRIAAALGGRGG